MRNMAGLVAVVGTVFLLALLSRPAAADPNEPLRALSVPAPTASVTIGQASGRATVTLENTTGLPVGVVVGKTFSHDRSATEVEAAWRRLPANEPPDANGGYTIQAGETATLEVRGAFPELGTYETSVRSLPGASPQSVFMVSVTRAAAPVPADLLLEPKPVRLQMGILQTLVPGYQGPKRALPLLALNTTTVPVDLGKAIAGPVSRAGSAAGTVVVTRSPPTVEASGLCETVQPGGGCVFTLDIPRDLGAGSYGIDVALQGPGGGQSMRTVTFDVRASPWLAALLIAIGVVLGAMVTDWRTTGRELAARRIAAADLLVRVQRLAGSATQVAVRRQALQLAEEVRSLGEALVEGGDRGEALEQAGARLGQLALAEQVLAAAAALDTGTRAFSDLTAELEGALNAGDWSEGRIDRPLATLRRELGAFPQLVRAVRRLDREMDGLREAAGIIESEGGSFAKRWEAASAAREQAFAPLAGNRDAAEGATRAADLGRLADGLAAATGDAAAAVLDRTAAELASALAANPAARVRKQLEGLLAEVEALRTGEGDRLRGAIALWRRASALVGAAPAEESAEITYEVKSVVPADSELKFVIDADAFLPGGGASAEAMRRARRRWNTLANLAVLAGIAAAGVLALWVPNSAWGTVPDIIAALLAGAGTRLAIGNIALRPA